MADLKTLIDKLIPARDSSYFNVDDIDSSVLAAYADQSDDYWKALLDYLQNENEADRLTHYLIRNGDLIRKNSLFQYIQSLTDLNEEAFSQYYDAIRILKTNNQSLTESNFWNESVADLVEYFISHFDFDYITNLEDNGYIETNDGATIPNGAIITNGVKFRIKDVQNANAGREFTSNPNGRWVRQWHNIDGDSYGKVRGSDKILSVLGDSSNLQFTRKAGDKKWIRLLMPAYTRKVEVEDLNRNFWVIGQTLTALCAYVFDNEQPMNNLIKKIMDEIMQLWENVLYLWAALMLASQKPYYTKIHKEVIYLPVNDDQPYLKYDNFSEQESSITWTSINKRLAYLKSQYPECHLAIVPVFRKQGYYHNYYGTERWMGVWFYNRNTDTVSHIEFNDSNISANDYASNSAALRMDENSLTVQYLYPFSNINEYSTTSALRFYQALRVVPTNFVVTFDINNNTLNLNKLDIVIYDMGRVIQNIAPASITGYRWNNTGTRTELSSYTNAPLAEQSTILEITPSCGYYLGELISASNVTTVPEVPPISDFTIEIKELLLPPIGTTVSEDLSSSHGAYLADSKWTTTTKTKLKNFNNKLLKLFAAPSEDKITLYLGKNKIDLWSSPVDYNSNGEVIHTSEMSGYKYPNSNGTLVSQSSYSPDFIDLNKLASNTTINQNASTAYNDYIQILASNATDDDNTHNSEGKSYTRSRQAMGVGAIIYIPNRGNYVFKGYEREDFLLPLKEEKYAEYIGNSASGANYKNLADIIFPIDTTDNYEANNNTVDNDSVHYGRRSFTYIKSKIYRKNGDTTLTEDNWFIIYEIATGTYIDSEYQIDRGINGISDTSDGEYTSVIKNEDEYILNAPIYGYSRQHKRNSNLKFSKQTIGEGSNQRLVYLGKDSNNNIIQPQKFLPVFTDVQVCIFVPKVSSYPCYQTIKSKIWYNNDRHLNHDRVDQNGVYPFNTRVTLNTNYSALTFLSNVQNNYEALQTTIKYSSNSCVKYANGACYIENYPIKDIKFGMLANIFPNFDS